MAERINPAENTMPEAAHVKPVWTLGRPRDFDIDVDRVFLSAGAGFVVAVCGEIMLMPGLPKNPAAEVIDIDVAGNITGLF